MMEGSSEPFYLKKKTKNKPCPAHGEKEEVLLCTSVFMCGHFGGKADKF